MSDLIDIGNNAYDVITSPEYSGITKVVLIVGEANDGSQTVYEAGNDSGRVLEIQNPWGTQQMAEDILNQVSGYKYKPFTAVDARIDPAAEIGDAIKVGGVYSAIMGEDLVFNALGVTTVSAPDNGELESEYPAEPESDRKITRRIAKAESTIRVNSEEIELRVKDATGVGTSLTITANGAAFADEDGNVVEINGGTLKAGTVEADYVVAGIEITAPTITGGEVYGGKYFSSDGSHYLELATGLNATSLQVNTANGSPIFSIWSGDGAACELTMKGLSVLGSDYREWSDHATGIVHAYANWRFENGIILSSDIYGSSLPSSGVEGQIFFLVI